MRFALPLIAFAGAVSAAGQSFVRVDATTLRLPATPPATTYSTTRAFPSLAFSQPVALVTPPGESRRLFVVEKTGRIYGIPDVTAAAPSRTLFLDLGSRVAVSSSFNDERGLLALAFHPNYASNGEFFVWYTIDTTTAAGSGLHNRLSRFHVSPANSNTADPGSEEPLLSQRDQAGNHNGGELLFGPDGYLYLSLGDEGGGNDQFQNSQRIDRDFFAGIIRIDVDRRPDSLPPNPHPAIHPGTYAIPPDNPFIGATTFNGSAVNPAAVRTEFWATGLRNPWRMSFDSATGQLWCADVGQGAREEINVIIRGGNYGWSYREGTITGPRGNPPTAAAFVPPVWDYGRSAGGSITGGFVYRGPRHAGLHGRYLFADFSSGRIWALAPNGENLVSSDRVVLLATDSGIASFGLDPASGDILLADLLEGAIKRLSASSAGGAEFPTALSETGAFSDVAALVPAAGVIPYEPNVSFWSDHALKRRWFALPSGTGQFGFASEGNWNLPTGAVWVKHFDLELTRGDPATARRIETRFLVKTDEGVYGLTYRWNDSQTDATLVAEEGADATFQVNEHGVIREQRWRFPSRAECQICHTAAGGHALSFNTRQLNRTHPFSGGTANIITALAEAGYLDTAVPPAPASLPALARAGDPTKSIELRARSYLDVNCSQCHQPSGTALGSWDARAATPLSHAGIIDGALVNQGGDPANRVVVPGDPALSHLLQRMAQRGPGQMPPLASHERDLAGEALLRSWISALGQPSLRPGRIMNLAGRAQVGTGANALFAGFVIAPGAAKHVLLRAVGPTLGAPPFNVPDALSDPVLTLHGPDSSTTVAAANDDWTPADAARFPVLGAFSLPNGSRDAALFAQLQPGSYTAVVAGREGGTGVALVEIYDADAAAVPEAAGVPSSALINTSVRAQVGTGANILIPGLVVGEGAPKTVLIRAIGPTLAAEPFNVSGVLTGPVLSVYAGAQSIAMNAGWSTSPIADAIRDATRAVGAFALPEGSRDSALLLSLAPGAYTIHVSGANNATGLALVEVYEVP